MKRRTGGSSMPDALSDLQTRFAGHIRDPQNVAAPGDVEDRRMEVYRNLFLNNIKSFLSGNFPVLRSLYDEAAWTRLCREFYSEYRCRTPLFPELPREFLKYLQEQREQRAGDPPFMLELAHYEWVELALTLDETEPGDIDAEPGGDLLSGIPVLSPLAWPLSYRYPVHLIKADYQPVSEPAEPTHLLVWRQRDYSIKFMQLNGVARLALQQMKEKPNRTGLDLLTAIADIIDHPRPQVVIEGGTGLLQDLRNKQVILGTRP
jgi:hypothetical protein